MGRWKRSNKRELLARIEPMVLAGWSLKRIGLEVGKTGVWVGELKKLLLADESYKGCKHCGCSLDSQTVGTTVPCENASPAE